MNSEINLISSRRKKTLSQEKTAAIFRVLAIVLLCFVVIVSIVLFYINQNIGFQSILSQEQTATNTLNASSQKIAKLLLIKSRVSDMQTILGERLSLDTTLSQVLAGVPADVTVDTISVDDKSVSLTLSSESLLSLNTFVDFAFAKEQQKVLFKTVSIGNITSDFQSGQYTLAIDATLL